MKKLKWYLVGLLAPIIMVGGITSILFFSFMSGDEDMSLSINGGCVISDGSYNGATIDTLLQDAGAFKGKRGAFETVAKKYKIDPILMIAISLHETGWGKSDAVLYHNNPSGQMRGGTIIHFNTLEEGLDMTGQTINNLWNERGLNTIEKLGSAYAPIGALNDPTGLNQHRVPTITKFVQQMGGLSGSCNDSFTASDKGFIMPVENPILTSGYVERVNPVTGMAESHKGLDFGQPFGSEVRAVADGQVIISQYDGVPVSGYGMAVLIKHSDTLYTLYGHQSKLNVAVGENVKQGQVIGLIGSTGQSSGPHLHFEVRLSMYGDFQNPVNYLPLN